MQDREKTILKAYDALSDIVESLHLMQGELAKLGGYEYIAYGPIAKAMGAAAEALCEVKKDMEGTND